MTSDCFSKDLMKNPEKWSLGIATISKGNGTFETNSLSDGGGKPKGQKTGLQAEWKVESQLGEASEDESISWSKSTGRPCSCAQQIPRGAPASLSPWGQHCPHKPGRMDRLLWISTEPARGLSSRTHHRGETALCCWVSRWICLIATGCSPSQVSKNYLPDK